MAIKVKHEGSAASRVAASASGGSAKRAMETAALAKGREIQQKQAAQAHAPSPGGAHAQLISAPGGSAHAQLVSAPGGSAHAQLIGGGGGIGASARLGGARPSASGRASSSSGSGGAYGQMKVTAHGVFNDPKDGSTYDRATDSWMRRYLPGEWEAEAKRRVGDVENALYEERQLTEQGRKERAALVNDITTAIRQGKFSHEEQTQLMKEYGIADENIRMADALRDRDPTPEERFRRNTFTNPDGVIFSPDGKLLYDPNEVQARRDDLKLRREETRQARLDANEQKRIAQMQKFVADLERPITLTEMGAGQDEEGNAIQVPQKVTRFLSEDEKNAALQRYMSAIGGLQGAESQTPTAGEVGNAGGAQQPPPPSSQQPTVPGFTPVSAPESAAPLVAGAKGTDAAAFAKAYGEYLERGGVDGDEEKKRK